ncbi:hypothetical protein [Helicobacter felis]|nr:hypothetical protein [Helicobacter felis]
MEPSSGTHKDKDVPFVRVGNLSSFEIGPIKVLLSLSQELKPFYHKE